MGYRLRMSGEIHDWLADLHDSDPAAALLAGQALAALIGEGASLGPPLVVPAAVTWPEDLVAALDASYQDRLERLQVMRRRAAEAAWLVRDMKDQIDVLESVQARLDDRHRRALEAGREEEAAKAADRLAAAQQEAAQARGMLPWITEAERWLETRLRRVERRTAAFRTRKELLKATYTATRAELQVNEEMAAAEPVSRDPAAAVPSGRDPAAAAPVSRDPAAAAPAGRDPAAAAPASRDPAAAAPASRDPAAAESAGHEATAAAAARLRDVTTEIERELGRQPLPEGLLELRPGAPDSEIRLIFAVEPPGTALLIAVLEGREAVRDQYRDAVTLSADVLLEARAGQAPEASAHGYDDTRSFAEEFFPGQAAEIDAGAAVLVARNRAHTLAEQRARFGLTQTELAERMGVPAEHVAAIERAEPGTTDVRTLASYVEALGGRLEIIAEFAGDRVVLR